MKHFFRTFAIKSLQSLLGVMLIVLPTAFLFTFIFSQPSVVKTFLKESGLYATMSNSIITNLTSGTMTQQALPVGPLTKAAQQTLPPETIQHKVELLIDDTYAWLYGEKSELSLQLNLTTETTQIKEAVVSDVVASMQQKTPCTATELQQLSSGSDLSSLSNLPCQPPGIDYEALRQQLTQSVASTQHAGLADAGTGNVPIQELFNTSPQDSGQQPSSIQAIGEVANTTVPAIFRVMFVSFYIGVVLVGLILGGLWLLIKDLPKFLGSAAKSLVVSGVLLLIYAGISLWLLNNSARLFQVDPTTQLQTVQASLRPFAGVSIATLFSFAGAYLVAGIGLLVLRGHVIHARTLRDAMRSATQETQPPTVQEVIRYNREHD